MTLLMYNIHVCKHTPFLIKEGSVDKNRRQEDKKRPKNQRGNFIEYMVNGELRVASWAKGNQAHIKVQHPIE